STFFWTRGDNALASIRGDAYPECGPPDAEVVLVARGNEPGWRLDLTDDSLILVSDYGESRVEAATPVPEITGADRRYAVATDAGELVISIADRLCADDATGMPHPYQVVIEKDGQTLRGCGGDPESLLEGDEWVVEDIVGQRVIEAAPPTILFEDGGVSGSTSCNRFSASYELTGEGLTVGLTAVTERACEDALMAQEDRFLEILRDLYRFSITPDGALVLHTADERTVTARR
ncbi:MAG: META domain-containing protein, partial [Gemmatimonadota bacterium]|nr:META domain-containing protein [Gemmatimonadota bacterium]